MKYFNPNWHQINKSIAAGDIKELRKEENELKRKIQDKIDAYYKNKRQSEVLAKIKALKDLPINSRIFYIANSDKIHWGSAGIKVKDGKTRMEISIDGKHWLAYYTNLKTDPPTPEEISSHKVTTRLTSFFNNHPLQ